MKTENKFIKLIKKLPLFLLPCILIYVLFIYNQKNESYTEIIETKNTNGSIIQEEINQNSISSEIMNENKCTYEINDDGQTILIHCVCDEDCAIVQTELDGYIIDEISPDAFEDNDYLEMIKIPKELANSVSYIKDFELSNTLTDDNYIIFSTTKEYNEDYLNYIKLSEEEKRNHEIIPHKFKPSNDNTINNDITNVYLPPSYDLRNHITVGVEDQNPFRNCYAYAILTSVETNIALHYNNTVKDFSEIHLSVKTKQGLGGRKF